MDKMDKNKGMNKTVKQPKDKRSVTGKLGHSIERVGEKLKDMGADRLGTAVYNTGNKIEHLKDNRN